MAETYESLFAQLAAMRAKGEIDAEEFSLARSYLREQYATTQSDAAGAPVLDPPGKEGVPEIRRRGLRAALTLGAWAIIGLGFVACVAGAPSGGSTKTAQSRDSRISKCFSAWDGSNRELVASVKGKLRDPSSFEHVGTRYKDRGTHLELVMQYRARNGFGGMNVEYAEGRCWL